VMTSSSSSSIVVLHAASIADSNSNTQQVVDCLVVGGGISGSTLAHNLKKAEVDVTSYVAKSRLAMHDASRPSMPSAETTKGEKWRRYGRFSLHPSYARPSRDDRCPLSFAIFLRVENASTIERVPLWLRIFTVWTLVSVSVAAFACAVQILLLLESIPSIPTIPTIPTIPARVVLLFPNWVTPVACLFSCRTKLAMRAFLPGAKGRTRSQQKVFQETQIDGSRSQTKGQRRRGSPHTQRKGESRSRTLLKRKGRETTQGTRSKSQGATRT
jgi:hypothetical protein